MPARARLGRELVAAVAAPAAPRASLSVSPRRSRCRARPRRPSTDCMVCVRPRLVGRERARHRWLCRGSSHTPCCLLTSCLSRVNRPEARVAQRETSHPRARLEAACGVRRPSDLRRVRLMHAGEAGLERFHQVQHLAAALRRDIGRDVLPVHLALDRLHDAIAHRVAGTWLGSNASFEGRFDELLRERELQRLGPRRRARAPRRWSAPRRRSGGTPW